LEEAVIPVFSDEVHGLPVFSVLLSRLVVEASNHFARGIVRAIGAGFQLPLLEAAHLHSAFGLVDVPISAFISQLAAAAMACYQFAAGLAVGATAPNLSD
jgi:hypothetical protein